MHTTKLLVLKGILLLFCINVDGDLLAQKKMLQSGPMVGYVEMREVLLWAQTTESAEVFFEYWEKESPQMKYRTARVNTEKVTAYTAKCIADKVLPGKQYQYRLFINKKPVALPYPTQFKTQTLWQWRTDPPEFTLAAGSCTYVNETEFDRPGKSYGSDYQIFTHLAARKPDLMLWLGDNAYYREPDWATRTGMNHRFTHSRSLPELQPVLAATANYAIWDDHDYGPNDADGTFIHKEMAWEVFKSFWGNPTYGLPGQKGCTSFFQYADVDFFLLDNRYFRSPNYCKTCPRTALGEMQLTWFLSALAASRAPFKIVAVGGQMVTNNQNHETFANYSSADRDTILKFIEKEKIKGVIFLTGDRHFTELSELTNANGNKVYDLTTSSMTAGSYSNGPEKEKNDYRVPGTGVGEHNFAQLRFFGARKDRSVELKIINAQGEEKWTKILRANDL